MADALTAPTLLAALLLCVAGVAKLRTPAPAAQALATAGLPGPQSAVRVFAAGELAIGAFSAVHPAQGTAVALAAIYAGFAVLGRLLTSRASSCGCFGAAESPASPVQSIVSLLLALCCAAAAGWPAHGIPWILHHSPIVASVFAIGIAGAVLGTVAAYTELPAAWTAWGPR
jgi:hypothetical protein